MESQMQQNGKREEEEDCIKLLEMHRRRFPYDPSRSIPIEQLQKIFFSKGRHTIMMDVTKEVRAFDEKGS